MSLKLPRISFDKPVHSPKSVSLSHDRKADRGGVQGLNLSEMAAGKKDARSNWTRRPICRRMNQSRLPGQPGAGFEPGRQTPSIFELH
jgi:hypothetical protein